MLQNELDELYAVAADEIANGQIQNGLWHRMVAEADGDEKVARARYLRERVQQLMGNPIGSATSPSQVHNAASDALMKILRSQILQEYEVVSIQPRDGSCIFTIKGESGVSKFGNPISLEKCGYINLDGNVTIGPSFERAFHFIGNFALVCIGDKTKDDNLRWGIIDRLGSYVVLPTYEHGTVKDGNIYLGRGEASERGFYISAEFKFDPVSRQLMDRGLRNAIGDFRGESKLLPAQYWHNNWPWNARNEKWGYVDRVGKWAIPADFQGQGTMFANDRAFVPIQLKPQPIYILIDTSGKKVGKLSFSLFDESWSEDGTIVVKAIDNGQTWWTHIGLNGEPLHGERLSRAGPFYQGAALAAVGPSGEPKCGLIDKSGKFILDPEFDDCHLLFNNSIAVKQGVNWGIIDFSKRWLLQPHFSSLVPYNEKIIFEKTEGVDRFGNPQKYLWYLSDKGVLGIA